MLSRLHAPLRSYSRAFSSQKPIRNIGIIAHIDAGKTTVTEKFLFLAGVTPCAGDVDSGTTVTDFLDMERERGITIQSSAVSFDWHGTHINLIDTPGHVDFTIEVERSMRVIDGVVVVLDGSSGVEAQTMTVWRQASKFSLPSVFFVNKMDKKSANFANSIDSIQQRLGVRAIGINSVVRSNNGAVGVVNLLNSTAIDLSKSDACWTPITPASKEHDIFVAGKEEMLYAIADLDPDFSKRFLDDLQGNSSQISSSEIQKALREIILSKTGSVVTCGSALRCSASVTPVLQTVVDFLPGLEETQGLDHLFGDQLSALVFKITHDKQKGRLGFARVYTGNLRNNAHLYNSTSSTLEGPLKIFIPYSDELQPAALLGPGSIAVVSGLKNTKTGDTLLDSETLGATAAALHHAAVKESKTLSHDHHHRHSNVVSQHKIEIVPGVKSERDSIALTGIESPDPVYYCSVEPPTTASQHAFERALKELEIEDPSMKCRIDHETGQTIIEAMGELHLEVIKDRLLHNYKLDVFFGPLEVGYREIVEAETVHTKTVEETLAGRAHSAKITFRVGPKLGAGKFKKVSVQLPSEPPSIAPRADWLRAINEGCQNALQNGPILGFPICDVNVILEGLVVSGGRVNSAILSACAHQCLTEALRNAGARLAEPVMKVEVTMQGSTDEHSLQPILQELAKRRAQIQTITPGLDSAIIECILPLAEMTSLSSTVRTLSSGFASLHVQVHDYQLLSGQEQDFVVQKLRGY